ncbi:hypothetical protein GCM10028795_18720 [Lysobacter olei]
MKEIMHPTTPAFLLPPPPLDGMADAGGHGVAKSRPWVACAGDSAQDAPMEPSSNPVRPGAHPQPQNSNHLNILKNPS